MRKTDAFRRAAALVAALSITVSLAAPAFAETYYIDDGDITITKDTDGKQTVQQNGTTKDDSGEIIITTREQTISTQESDLEGPAAEDSGFGPVVEDNYQPAQPESADQPENTDRQEDADRQESADQLENTDQPKDAEEPKAADRQESAEEQESAGQQAQPQQAAPAAAPAAPTSVITLINNFANTVLNLTLKDVKIDVSDTGTLSGDMGRAALSVQGEGNVEIELDGKNELKSGVLRAGLEKTSTGTLTLKDDNQKAGSLTATGNYNGAGIGGGHARNGENITINGGTVNATGGFFGAGIGGGIGGYGRGNGKNITINGGTVNAAGGVFGAGIGGGREGKGSNVTVSGAAQVTATAGKGNRIYYYGTGATIGNGGNWALELNLSTARRSRRTSAA